MSPNDEKITIFSNRDVRRIIAFIPEGHRHIRVYIEAGEWKMVFQEATVAAIVRAYIDVKTHSKRNVVELISKKLDERKPGYAEYQLVESGREEKDILKEIESTLD